MATIDIYGLTRTVERIRLVTEESPTSAFTFVSDTMYDPDDINAEWENQTPVRTVVLIGWEEWNYVVYMVDEYHETRMYFIACD